MVILSCSVLAFGAVVLLVMNQFKDEKPSWENYLGADFKKYWRIKK